MLTTLSLVAQLLLAFPSWAQDAKVGVSVLHSGADPVGKQLAYALKEAIRGSNGYRLTPGVEGQIRVSIVTVDPDRSSSGNSTAAAVTYTMVNNVPLQKGNPQTWYPIYLTTMVAMVGSKRVDEQAQTLMATLDDAMDRYWRNSKN
jgi:hypothetical protein